MWQNFDTITHSCKVNLQTGAIIATERKQGRQLMTSIFTPPNHFPHTDEDRIILAARRIITGDNDQKQEAENL